MLFVCHPKILHLSIVFSFSWELKWHQEKLKTMLMQNFGVTNKEHYGMLWYFLEWSIGRQAPEGKTNCAGRENCQSNGIHEGKNWHQIRISRTGHRQKICESLQSLQWRSEEIFFCPGELGGLCCQWSAYHQNLDRIDEIKHLPGAWIWKTFHVSSSPPCWWTVNKRSLISSLCLSTNICSFHHRYLCLPRLHENLWKPPIVLFFWRRPAVCCLSLVTAAENVSVQFACVLKFRSTKGLFTWR